MMCVSSSHAACYTVHARPLRRAPTSQTRVTPLRPSLSHLHAPTAKERDSALTARDTTDLDGELQAGDVDVGIDGESHSRSIG